MSTEQLTDKRGNPMNEHNLKEHRAKLERLALKAQQKAQQKATITAERVAKTTSTKTKIAKKATKGPTSETIAKNPAPITDSTAPSTEIAAAV